MSFALRSPIQNDYKAIAAWVPHAAACARWAGLRVPFPFAAADLSTLLSVTGGQSYCLAEGDGVPCGFGQHWVVTQGAVHLGRIIVSPACRGQGLGRVLCEQLIARGLQVRAARAVTLRVYRDNAAAFGLYASLGFVPVESESDAEVLFMRLAV